MVSPLQRASSFESNPRHSDDINTSINNVLNILDSFDAIQLKQLGTLIHNLENMRGSTSAAVALEILKPMYAYKTIEHENTPDDDKENNLKFAERFFEARLTKKSVSAIEAAENLILGENTKKQLRHLFTTYQVQTVALHKASSPKMSLANTCYFHSTLNIILKNPILRLLIKESNPTTDAGQYIKNVLENISTKYQNNNTNDIESDDSFIALLSAYSQILTKSNSATSGSITRQQDSEEMLSLVFNELNINVDGEAKQKKSSFVYVQEQPTQGLQSIAEVTQGTNDDEVTIAGISIHAGTTISSETGGISSASGHYMSLVNTGGRSWQLYNNQNLLSEYNDIAYSDVLAVIEKDHVRIQNAYCKGVYTF